MFISDIANKLTEIENKYQMFDINKIHYDESTDKVYVSISIEQPNGKNFYTTVVLYNF